MRIIAGEFRGRKLLAPEGDATRPVTDRVKQSVFDIVAPFIDGATVFDVFAGTGSMGLECLSRGAARALCFEADRSALALLKQNIATLKLTADQCQVIPGDLFAWFDRAATLPDPPSADLIFLDPPYRFLRERADDLLRLSDHLARRHLSPSGFVIFRHDARDELELAPLPRYDRRSYGGMVVDLLRPPPR